MTLEASVVRLSDIIAYIGRDIEDAIIVGSIKREDIPNECKKVIGETNAQIVNTLILDVIKNSIDKSYLCFSEDIFENLIFLKKWNAENIYNSKEARKNLDILEQAFYDLYDYYIKLLNGRKHIDMKENMTHTEKSLYKFINNYRNKDTDIRRIVIDYISGQTDNFFLKECESNINGFRI